MIDGVRVVADGILRAVRDHASSLLTCPGDELKVRDADLGTPHSPVPVYLVDGCTQRLVYFQTPKAGVLVLVSRFTLGPTAH